MDDLNSLMIFAAVASRRSFGEAARVLGVPKATISRKVKDLEARLGVRLLQRTTRRVTLTEAGSTLLDHCTRIAGELEAAEAAVAHLRGIPRGVLRVSAPFTLARSLLVPVLPDFMVRHPDLRVVLTLRNDDEDVVTAGEDVALVAGEPARASSHPSRLLANVPVHACASPAYLRRRREPRVPSDLADHDCLVHSRDTHAKRFEWRLLSAAPAREDHVTVRPVLVSNDITPLFFAALDGRGILFAPDPLTARAEAEGRLVRLLPQWHGPELQVRAVFASRRGLAPKIRLFIDFLAERFARSLAEVSSTGLTLI